MQTRTNKKIMASLLALMLVMGNVGAFFSYASSFDEMKTGTKINIPISDNVTLSAIFIKKQYDKIYNFKEGLAVVKKDGKYGFIDKSGKEVVELKYDDAYSFSDGLAAVNQGKTYDSDGNIKDYGLWAYIDKTGKRVIPFNYTFARSFSDGLASVWIETDKEYIHKYINKQGKTVLKQNPDYYASSYGDFKNGLARVQNKNDGLIGYIDKTGKEIIPCVYVPHELGLASKYYYGFSENVVQVAEPYTDDNGNILYKLKCFNNKGVELFSKDSVQIDSDDDGKNEKLMLFSYHDGLARYIQDGKYGFIDKVGAIVIPCIYDYVTDFNEGMALARKGEDLGYINTKGEEIIFGKYQYINNFSDGLATFAKSKENEKTLYGCIDKHGNEIIPCVLADPLYFQEGIYASHIGSIDKSGTIEKAYVLYHNPLYNTSNQVQTNDITATYSEQALVVDGELKSGLEVYNIDGNNYFKLRDIAALANGKKAQFSVAWNGEKQLISLLKGEAYQPNGSELQAGDKTNKTAIKSPAKLEIDGEVANLNAYTINSQNYFKLRDLGEALGFKVDWDDINKQIVVEMK